MGQKTHPIGFRLGVIKSWRSKWFVEKNYPAFLQEDWMIRRYITKRIENAGIADIEISRAPKKVSVDIHTSRPGIVIGRKGAEVDKLRDELKYLSKKDISLNIIEVRNPESNAKLVADNIARQLEGRVSHRRVIKKAIAAARRQGILGIKIACGGRIGGAEIARKEKYMEGRVPLHTLRADIDFAQSTANTTYGTIGVKVWIFKGEILDRGAAMRGETETSERRSSQELPQRGRRPESKPVSRGPKRRKSETEEVPGKEAEG
ncbi:MAG: 30S ribosomal protein S3 [candidate division Zixibacteria bacterium]|nr:30S ribosomal protein S3 [candidate division Zixibacteria bacterium]